MAKDVCRARSLQGVTNALVCIARMMFRTSPDDLVRSLLFSDNAYAIDEYKWESKWNTQLAPLARRVLNLGISVVFNVKVIYHL